MYIKKAMSPFNQRNPLVGMVQVKYEQVWTEIQRYIKFVLGFSVFSAMIFIIEILLYIIVFPSNLLVLSIILVIRGAGIIIFLISKFLEVHQFIQSDPGLASITEIEKMIFDDVINITSERIMNIHSTLSSSYGYITSAIESLKSTAIIVFTIYFATSISIIIILVWGNYL